MKSNNELAEEYMQTHRSLNTSATRYDAFIAGFDSRDAEIAALKQKDEEAIERELGLCRDISFLYVKIQTLEQEKKNLLAAAETDLLRMAELRDENAYLKGRVAKHEEKWLGRA